MVVYWELVYKLLYKPVIKTRQYPGSEPEKCLYLVFKSDISDLKKNIRINPINSSGKIFSGPRSNGSLDHIIFDHDEYLLLRSRNRTSRSRHWSNWNMGNRMSILHFHRYDWILYYSVQIKKWTRGRMQSGIQKQKDHGWKML